MAKDLAESLLADDGIDPHAIAARFAASYRWSRGYGPGVARVLKRIRRGERWETAATAVHRGGSFGNGAAMRAPVLALFFANDRERLVDAARTTARITHAHPLGIEGAVLIAVATVAMLDDPTPTAALESVRATCLAPEFTERLSLVASWLDEPVAVPAREVAQRLGNGVTALTSCATALYVALRHVALPFDQMMQFVVACRGDVDTIGAMAGAMWGAANGARALPVIALEARDELTRLATRLFARL